MERHLPLTMPELRVVYDACERHLEALQDAELELDAGPGRSAIVAQQKLLDEVLTDIFNIIGEG